MLRHTADLRTIAFVFAYFALLVAAFTLELPWWGWPVFMVPICLLSFFLAVATHNTIHSPVFKSRALNSIFRALLTVCYGHPVSMYVPGHNLSHHKYTQRTKDRMRTDKMRFRWNLLNQLFFSFVVGPPIFKDNARFARAMRRVNPKWYRQFLIELVAYIGFLIAFALLDPVKLWGFLPLKFIVFVMIPHQYAAWGIMGINFVQHDGCDGEHPYNQSRNFTGRLVNWFTFNNGFHGVHHMQPGLHWSLLREAHEETLAPHIHPNLNRVALLPYLIEAYVWPGKRVTFEGEPLVLPPPREDEDWMPAKLKAELDLSDADFVPLEASRS